MYTGDGKGKTTAAVGVAIRAIAHNLRVCYVYFHKDPDRWGSSEHGILKKNGIDVFGFAGKSPLFNKNADFGEIRERCLKGMDFIKELYRQNKYDLLILDEINISLRDGFLKTEEIMPLLTTKPAGLELVLTGRGATPELMELADLVSNIKKIKHPYDKGVKARKGIEY